MRNLAIRHNGFTLIELLVAICIIGILAVAAMPAFAGYLANARLREAANVVLANALWARSEAVKRNATVTLSVSSATVQVSVSEGTAPTVLRSMPLQGIVLDTSFSASFDSVGRQTPFGTERVLALRPAQSACSADIRCPTVRFDAGGFVGICATGVCE